MKANELMIGDWVLINGIQTKITSILGRSESNSIQPIPLTPEILEKNGFEEVELNNFRLFIDKEYKCDDIRISFTRKGFCFWKGDLVSIVCKRSGCCHYGIPAYVHLLQHALRLCGIEKEIVL